jgi:hypothetical protein
MSARMDDPQTEAKRRREQMEAQLDDALAATFSASDPISITAYAEEVKDHDPEWFIKSRST